MRGILAKASNDIADVIPLTKAGNWKRTACPRLGQPAPPAVPAQDDSECVRRAKNFEVSSTEEVKGLLSLLEEKPVKSHTDWKGRYRENLEKMKTGRLEDVADVLKNLSEVQKRKSLSFREKKMYDRAKYLLVSEVAIVKGMPEPEAEKLIHKCIEKSLGAAPVAVAGGH